MDAVHLTDANRMVNTDTSPIHDSRPARLNPPSKPDKRRVRAALDRIIRNTRFQYAIKDKLGYFVVRIIDRDTDKVIREIPSKEFQKVHEGIDEALGLLFDELI